jgi:hypothetical protein
MHSQSVIAVPFHKTAWLPLSPRLSGLIYGISDGVATQAGKRGHFAILPERSAKNDVAGKQTASNNLPVVIDIISSIECSAKGGELSRSRPRRGLLFDQSH